MHRKCMHINVFGCELHIWTYDLRSLWVLSSCTRNRCQNAAHQLNDLIASCDIQVSIYHSKYVCIHIFYATINQQKSGFIKKEMVWLQIICDSSCGKECKYLTAGMRSCVMAEDTIKWNCQGPPLKERNNISSADSKSNSNKDEVK